MRCFWFDKSFSQIEGNVELSIEESRHIKRVLRLQLGEQIQLINGIGELAVAELISFAGSNSKPVAMVAIVEVTEFQPPSKRLHLYTAIPRNRLMDQILRQVTELGVCSIIPIITEFSVAKPSAKENSRWQSQLMEACKQSLNPFIPQLKPVVDFSTAIENCQFPGYYGAVPSENVADCAIIEQGDVAFWIGPEGGFSDQELAVLANRFSGITIGQNILRVETAVVAALARII
jgi:16S rRNA (uracil1498-N3)-methyltransferase